MMHRLRLTTGQIFAITKLSTTSGRKDAEMDPSQDQGAPGQRRPDRRRQRDRSQPQPQLHISQQRPIALAHPVIAGYNGSPSARNALAYAAGMARRLDRPLLIVYVTSPGVYCEPMTGQVVGLLRDADSLERWLLAELDQAADSGGREGHGRPAGCCPISTRRQTPAFSRCTSAPGASARPASSPQSPPSSVPTPWLS